jgi:citrate lyase subunit beta/citryl-CoA lyase
MLQKASTFLPDVYIPDLEDSVSINHKIDARQIVSENLILFRNSGRLVIPRVNSIESGLFESDISSLISKGIDGISIGKINTPEDIMEIDRCITKYEMEFNIEKGSTVLIPWIESASAIINSTEILKSSKRIVAAAFGAEDFTHDMGIERLSDDTEIQFAKNYLSVSAKALNIIALDNPYFDFKNSLGLIENSIKSKNIGYKGKFAIHPAQIDAINKSFSPTKHEIERAEEIISVFQESVSRGRGSTSLNGQVIDVPVFKRATALIELANKMKVN